MIQRLLRKINIKEREDRAMAKKKNNNGMSYIEPSNYFPEDIRREFKLGEFNDEVDEDEMDEEMDEE